MRIICHGNKFVSFGLMCHTNCTFHWWYLHFAKMWIRRSKIQPLRMDSIPMQCDVKQCSIHSVHWGVHIFSLVQNLTVVTTWLCFSPSHTHTQKPVQNTNHFTTSSIQMILIDIVDLSIESFYLFLSLSFSFFLFLFPHLYPIRLCLSVSLIFFSISLFSFSFYFNGIHCYSCKVSSLRWNANVTGGIAIFRKFITIFAREFHFG